MIASWYFEYLTNIPLKANLTFNSIFLATVLGKFEPSQLKNPFVLYQNFRSTQTLVHVLVIFDSYATGQAIPMLSAIIPIRHALSQNVLEAVDVRRSKAKAVKVSSVQHPFRSAINLQSSVVMLPFICPVIGCRLTPFRFLSSSNTPLYSSAFPARTFATVTNKHGRWT